MGNADPDPDYFDGDPHHVNSCTGTIIFLRKTANGKLVVPETLVPVPLKMVRSYMFFSCFLRANN